MLTSQLTEMGLQSLCSVAVSVQTVENCSSLLLLYHYGNSCLICCSLSYISLFQNDCFLPPVTYVLGCCCASVTRAGNRAKSCSTAVRALIFSELFLESYDNFFFFIFTSLYYGRTSRLFFFSLGVGLLYQTFYVVSFIIYFFSKEKNQKKQLMAYIYGEKPPIM